MLRNRKFHRREVFKLAGGLGATLTLAQPQSAKTQVAPPALSGSDGALPRRGEFLIKGGHVLTMDTNLGDLPNGDVHVRDGAIVAIGNNLPAGAEVIDGRGMIVMPGFVDTHWHLWCTALRLIVRADDPKEGYFPTTIRVGRHYTPEDSYIGVRLGTAEGLLSGITTVHDWSHNTVSPQHADAEIQALKDIGIRARFSYGTGQGHAADKIMDLTDLARVQKQWTAADGMLHIGA
jgi:cytosine/adenosine deaminase-related metal-dependent hydrolase